MVIWITGLSGSGKTTLCDALVELLKPRLPELIVLDGDVVRAAFGHNLSHNESDRIVQACRLQAISGVLSKQGMVVIVGVLYGNPELLAWNRANLPDYFEVYLNASLETVSARDPKGLYAEASEGKMVDVVGIDVPWYAPQKPDMVFDLDNPQPATVMAHRLALALPRLSAALPKDLPALGGIG